MMLDVRRSPGTGTAPRLRRDGRWESRVTVGRKDGHQHQRSFFGHTAQEAERKRDEALRQLDGGIILAGERVTVERYLRDWLEVRRPPALRLSTWTRYRQIVEHNILPGLGHVPLLKLTPGAVERYLVTLPVAPRTQHHVRAVLRTALDRAVRHGLLVRNVAALAQAPRVDAPEQVVLDPAQVRTLLDQVRGDRWEALYVLAIATGLRQGELLGLRREDVDLEAGELRVAFQLHHRQLVAPKTVKSRRQVGLPVAAIAALRAHLLRQEQQRRFVARGDWANTAGLLFTNSFGGPIHGPHVTREFHRHLARAGLPSLPFHALRHTAASLMLAQGVDLKVIQQVLGHANIRTTAGTYTHVLPELLRDAADRMDEVLHG